MLALVGAGCAVVAFGESLADEPFVCSNEVLTAVYDAKGGVLKRLFFRGREWTEPGMTSFRDRIFVQTGEETCEVAALHSQNSLFVAMGMDGVAGWHSSQSSWWRVLSDLKVPFRYVTREMLEKGLDAKFRAMVLPAVHASSPTSRPDGLTSTGYTRMYAVLAEKPGVWRLAVRHVNTSTEREIRFEIR